MRSTAAAWRLGETAVGMGLAAIEVKASLDWCLAHEWTMQADWLKASGGRDLSQVPMTCLHRTASDRFIPREISAAEGNSGFHFFFSPLTMRHETLHLYQFP